MINIITPFFCFLLLTPYAICITPYSLLFSWSSVFSLRLPFSVYYILSTAYCLLSSPYSFRSTPYALLPTVFLVLCFLSSVFRFLFTTYSLLPTTYYLLFSPYSLRSTPYALLPTVFLVFRLLPFTLVLPIFFHYKNLLTYLLYLFIILPD
ncbi:hypothetical protein ES703_13778 [subsurface metagenome]